MTVGWNAASWLVHAGLLLLAAGGCSAGPVQGTSAVEEPGERCEPSKCPGPLKYYEDLGCRPVRQEQTGSCCPASYDCSHLTSGRSRDKCYANGHEYALGQRLRDEDRGGPCDICTCVLRPRQARATFDCALVDCFDQPALKDGCFLRRDLDSCCGGQQVCPETTRDRVTCQVDGETYLDGEQFTPKSEPELHCQCMPGYRGENREPFCRPLSCATEVRHIGHFWQSCAPVFQPDQSPATHCRAHQYRCQNSNDRLLTPAGAHGKSTASEPASGQVTCKFGNMSMLVGQELNQATDYDSVCVKCVCEVPPVPTCQRLPDSECDVTSHPPFD